MEFSEILYKRFTLKKENLYAFFTFSIVFLWSLIVYPWYIEGDQSSYRLFYEEVKGLSLVDTYLRQLPIIGGLEPGYSIVVYSFSEIFNKDIIFSFINGLIGALLYKICRLYSYSTFIFIGILTSFYSSVIFFAAERLKLGILVILIAFLFKDNFKRLFILSGAILFHLQSLFALLLFFIYKLTRRANLVRLYKFKLDGINKYFLLILALSFLVIYLDLFNFFIQKAGNYISKAELNFDMLKPIILGVPALLIGRDKFLHFALLIFWTSAGLFIDTDRVVMMQVLSIIFLLDSKKNKIFNWAYLSSLFIYFFIKNIIFIIDIYNCGEGFTCR